MMEILLFSLDGFITRKRPYAEGYRSRIKGKLGSVTVYISYLS